MGKDRELLFLVWYQKMAFNSFSAPFKSFSTMASGRVCYIYLFPLKQVFMESLLRAGRAGDKAANETQG